MNTMTIIILVALIADIPALPESAWENRRAARNRAIARNHRLYVATRGRGHWTESVAKDGLFHTWNGGQTHSNDQNGRWADYSFGGHRRSQKWSRDYYPSWRDEKARCWAEADRRWEERYGK